MVLAYEQLISYINHLGQVFALYWVTHGPLICFYLIITAARHNRVWDPGFGRLYLWTNEDFIVVMVLIRTDQFTGAGAEFFQRVIWDLGTRLTGGLQHDTLLHSLIELFSVQATQSTVDFYGIQGSS